MKKMTYNEYLNSSTWRNKSNAAKSRAGYRCQLCNASPGVNKLHSHHRTYERLGHEDEMDLTVLCEDCHKYFHTWRKIVNDESPMLPLFAFAAVKEVILKPDGNDVL